MALLKGKKTYIVALVGAVIFVLARFGVFTPEVEAQIYTALGIVGVATFRNAIAK